VDCAASTPPRAAGALSHVNGARQVRTQTGRMPSKGIDCRTKLVCVCLLALALSMAASGCASLLPHGSTRTASPFASFDEARAAIERVTPYRTRTSELRDLGFDLRDSTNMREVPYPEVVAKLAPNPSIPLELLDPGIRDCILARQACRAYEFRLSEQTRQRTGAFLLDFLNFRRTTEITGWHFEGLLVVRDDLVLFRNHGGEPQLQRTERQSNPLGPLQPAGEATGGLLLR
jgi:hypothetical protein